MENLIKNLLSNEKDGKEIIENDALIMDVISNFPEIVKIKDFYSLKFDSIQKLSKIFFKNAYEEYPDEDVNSFIIDTSSILLKNLSKMKIENTILLLNDILLCKPTLKECVNVIGLVTTSYVCKTLKSLFEEDETSVEQDFEYEIETRTKTIEKLQSRITELEKSVPVKEEPKFKLFNIYLTEILRYSFSGDMQNLINCIEIRHLPVDMEGEQNRTPLIVAAQAGELEVVKYLISKGAKLDKIDKNGFTALSIACFCNHFEVVDYLVKKGADVICLNNKIPPIAAAIYNNNLDIIKYLLDHGVPLNSRFWTDPLTYATIANNYDIVKHFLDKGANPDSLYGKTPLFIACQNAYVNIVKLLLERGASPNFLTPITKLTPLHAAAINGNTEIIQILIKAGAYVNPKGLVTPISFAVSHGNFDAVVTLINEGAKINIHQSNDNVRYSPLYVACAKGYLNIVMFLVESGAKIEIKDTNNATPLIVASIKNYSRIVEFLVNRGANVNAQTTSGDTALIYASKNSNVELVKFLLSKGADPSLKGKLWRTAYSVANHPIIKQILENQQQNH